MWKYTDKGLCNEFLLSLNLFKCNDNKKYIKILYSIANTKEKNYRIYKIKKSNGKLRTIYAPNELLKEIQRNILDKVLSEREVSKYAKAYVRDCSLKDNCLPHINKKIILKLDIEKFFDNISFTDVYNSCFPIEYYPKSIGMLFTYLCTYNDYLPQGAVTSPYISNLVMKKFDEELGNACEASGISYTRYSDDMTFSGDFDVSSLITKVQKMLNKKGLKLNYKKIHVVKNNSSQRVTGLVVNEKVNVDNKYKRMIRQELYYINKYGIASHMKRINVKDKKSYLNKLFGRIMFVLQIDSDNKEFLEYKKIVFNLKKNCKSIS